ncbi:MAG: hypothetical protein NTV49_13510, partial [Kiritimatiellaeota bacterium]|nr:hypothetical protein [Kiritimatiellota bacterium]
AAIGFGGYVPPLEFDAGHGIGFEIRRLAPVFFENVSGEKQKRKVGASKSGKRVERAKAEDVKVLGFD